MKRLLMFLIGIVLILGLVGYSLAIYGEKWVNDNLESILNQNPDQKYEFKLGEVDFKIFEGAIYLKNLKINSLLPDTVTHVRGEIEEAFLRNVHPLKLIFNRHLLIDDLSFIHPTIQVNLFANAEKKDRPGSALQEFFGEILSKGEIENFQLTRGAAVFFENGSRSGTIYSLGILVNGLQTDSIKVQYPIPFEYKQVKFSFDSLVYQLADGQSLKLGKMHFDSELEQFALEDISLKYQEDIRQFARKQLYQKDLIEVEVDSLKLTGFGPEIRLHSDVDIRARKLELFGLDLRDFRDKALPRPKEDIKPMFQGMITQVNFPLRLDTLKITDSKISYGESVPQKNDFWTIHFDKLDARIVNLTTIHEYQKEKKSFDLEMSSSLEGFGQVNAKIVVPYERDEYQLDLDFRNYSLPQLNQLLRPIMNGEIASGKLDRLALSLKATEKTARVNLIFDYKELKVDLFNKSGEKKNKLMSSLANIAINQSNMPGEKKYQQPNYTVIRNQYRGPFHLIWKSTKEGILEIIPGGAAKEILMSTGN